jgi:outer membrane lipoprotein-sorting protein
MGSAGTSPSISDPTALIIDEIRPLHSEPFSYERKGDFTSGYWSRISVMPGRKLALQTALLFLLLTVCSVCSAQQLSANEILKRVGEMYRGLQTYQFVAEDVSEFDSHRFTSEVALSVANPGKIRLEVRDDDGVSLQVSDGQTRWIYLPNRKQYIAEPGSGDEAVTREGKKLDSPTYRSLLVERFRNLPEESSSAIVEREDRLTVGAHTVACHLLKIQRQDGFVDELWVDKDRYIVWKSKHAAPMIGKRTLPTITITLSEAKLSAELEKNTFQFDPPANAKQVRSFK